MNRAAIGPSVVIGIGPDGEVILTWTAPATGNIAGYNVYRNGEKLNRTDLAPLATASASTTFGSDLPERAIDGVAYERFTPQGPLAVLPVADGRAGFVWTVSADDAGRVMALDDDAFLEELQREFGYRLGAFSRVGKRASYPLVLSKALRLTATRSVLIGNAAHGLHPVSAQGFNLGMRDVAAIVDCIADARTEPGEFDPGAATLLARYAEWRRADQKKLVRFTDGLVKLFGSERRPLRMLRNIGMLGFDLVPGVRSVFAKHTMGLAGRLPRLSRGVPVR